MKFTAITALSALLCADVALAAVPADRREVRRLARRADRARRTKPYYSTSSKDATVQSNWGGAILTGSGFTGAQATVNAPTGGGGGSAAGSAWTGFDWYGDGTYDAWYEWYPEVASDFSGISISAGDNIQMSVVATDSNSGSATLSNLSNDQSVTHQFNDISAGSLCETSAEFIIEDFEECSSGGSNCQPVPFASFSPAVTFSDASATQNGQTVGPNGATLSQVIVDNQDLTSCSVSGSSVVCNYE